MTPVAQGRDSNPDRSATHVRRALWTVLAVGILVFLVGVLVLVKVLGGSTQPRVATNLTATSASVLAAVTSIPQSVYDEVAVSSPTVPVVPPRAVPGGASALTFTRGGRRLPGVLYVGTEYSSFSASERWALIAALSRFGRFSSLYDVESTPLDFSPSTPTFTFYASSYSSHLVAFDPFEVRSNAVASTGFRALMSLPRRDARLLRRDDPTMTVPFVDIGNRVETLQAAFSPQTLAGLSRDQVAEGLADPTNPVTRAIVASANYLTAAICAVDRGRPGSVCASVGVTAAAAALHLELSSSQS